MPVKWIYNATRHVFINERTGKELTHRQMVTIRDAFVDSRKAYVQAIVEQYTSGAMTLAELNTALAATTSETITALSVIGAGGQQRAAQMGPTFRDIVQSILDKQVPFFGKFMAETANGSVSDAELANRAGLYQDAAIQAYEQSNAAEAGIEDLPYWPGDWGTECKAGCRCAWEFETVYEGDDEVTYATWQTEEDDAVCDDCQFRSNAWQRREIGRVRGAAPQVEAA